MIYLVVKTDDHDFVHRGTPEKDEAQEWCDDLNANHDADWEIIEREG